MSNKEDRVRAETESLFTTKNREKKSLVSLGGVAETESGKLTKSNYFRFLGHDLDDYTNIKFTPQEAKRIHSHLSKLSTGSTAMVPLFCGGDICPFKERCPFFAMDKAPIGKQCILEVQTLKEFTIRYFNEFDVDPNNWTEVGYVNELAEIDIYLSRLKYLVAKPENAELIIEQTVGMSQQEIPIIQKQLSPYMEQMEKLNNRKSKIIKLMVGDRQEKYKKEAALKMKIDKDPSSVQAQLRSRLENLQRSMDQVPATSQSIEVKKEGVITPEDIIDSIDDNDGIS